MASSRANGLRESSSLALSSTGRFSDMGTLRGQRSPSSTIHRATGYPARPGRSRPDRELPARWDSSYWWEALLPRKESVMTPHMRYGLIGIVIGLILFIWSPLAAIVVIAAAIAIPVVAYRMLSPSQRQRLRENRRRKQIGGSPQKGWETRT